MKFDIEILAYGAFLIAGYLVGRYDERRNKSYYTAAFWIVAFVVVSILAGSGII